MSDNDFLYRQFPGKDGSDIHKPTEEQEQAEILNTLKIKPSMTPEIIEAEVKRLTKESTAPDKETPDWMETDIRRGIYAGIKMFGSELLRVKELLHKEFYINGRTVYGEDVWKQYCINNKTNYEEQGAEFGYSLSTQEAEKRIKELEEVIENNNQVLKSILDDLPKQGLGLIFVKQQIASNDKYLENNL